MVVGIATRYGLYGSGIESWWEAKFSAPVQTGPGLHPLHEASVTISTGSFSGLSCRSLSINIHLHLPARLKKELYYTSALLCAFIVGNGVKFTVTLLMELLYLQ